MNTYKNKTKAIRASYDWPCALELSNGSVECYVHGDRYTLIPSGTLTSYIEISGINLLANYKRRQSTGKARRLIRQAECMASTDRLIPANVQITG